MTKKAAALLLAASLAVSVCAMPVFATGGTTPIMGSQNGDTTGTGTTTNVIYKVKDEFTWTVPVTIDFGVSAGPKEKTRVVDANLETGDGTAATNGTTGGTNGTAPKVLVTKNVIDPANSLYISLGAGTAGTFEVTHTTSNTVKLGYTVKAKNAKIGDGTADTTEKNVEKTGTDILVVPAGTDTGEVDLVFTLTTTKDSAEKSGDYKGTVTFTATSKITT